MILTDTSISGFHKIIVRWTATDVFALCVDAGTILARLRAFTLVYVSAIAAGAIEFVALVTLAAEHAKDVFTVAENTQIAEHLALVDVYASLLVVFVRVHETHLALAAIGTWIIQTMPVLAKCAVLRALVYVLAAVAVASKAGVAYALREPILKSIRKFIF